MRKVAKKLMRMTFAGIVLPLVILHRLHARLVGADRALSNWSQLVGMIPGDGGVYFRHAFYQWALLRIEEDACVSFGVLFSHARSCLGRGCYIGPYCVVGEVEIGKDVLVGSQVSITNGSRQHGIGRLDIPVREQPGEWPRIKIGQDTWIGDRAIIMANVGKHAVVGAGSVVTKPVEDYAVVVGNPARKIGDRREIANASESKSLTEAK